ncbi:MAG: helix-turn-helix domain-containing protein [Oscillospiraceae bacterium]
MYNKIEKLCKENNTNITEMCRELQIPRSSMSELKAGRVKSMAIERIELIADYFGVSSDYLRGKDENDSIKAFDETGEPLFIDDEVREIVDSLRTRPEMKILFSASKKATKEDIMKTVKIIEALRNGEND